MGIALTALVEREQDLCHAYKLPRLGANPRLSSVLTGDLLWERHSISPFRI